MLGGAVGDVKVDGASIVSDGVANIDLTGKQEKIDDLDTIRSDAAKGATAVQTEIDPTVPDWAKQTTKPTYTASEIKDSNGNTVQEDIVSINSAIETNKENISRIKNNEKTVTAGYVWTATSEGAEFKKSTGGSTLVVQKEEPEDTSVIWVDTDDDSKRGYTLPIATADTLGGIKVGDGLSVEDDGTLSSGVPVSIEASDILTMKSGYTIVSFEAYKIGRVVYITRLTISGSFSTNEVSVAEFNTGYNPINTTWARTIVMTNTTTFGVLFFKNGEVINVQMGKSTTDNIYVPVFSYICEQ